MVDVQDNKKLQCVILSAVGVQRGNYNSIGARGFGVEGKGSGDGVEGFG